MAKQRIKILSNLLIVLRVKEKNDVVSYSFAWREKSLTLDICYPGDERLAPEKRMIRSCQMQK